MKVEVKTRRAKKFHVRSSNPAHHVQRCPQRPSRLYDADISCLASSKVHDPRVMAAVSILAVGEQGVVVGAACTV